MPHFFKHKIVHFCGGRGNGNRTVFLLVCGKTVQPALVKGGHFLVEHTGFAVHQHIARPACLLALGAVCGDGHHIVALRIADIFIQLFKISVVTGEAAFVFLGGRQQHRLKILRRCIGSPFDPDVAESVEGKHRFVGDFFAAANYRFPLAGAQRSKIAVVGIQHFGVMDAHLGTAFFPQLDTAAPGYDLPKVKNHLPLGVFDDPFDLEGFHRANRLQRLRTQHIEGIRLYLHRCMGRPRLGKIDFFPHKQIRIQDVGLTAYFRAVTCNNLACAVCIGDFQLIQDGRLFVVSPYGGGLAVEVPAVAHQHFQRIFALLQQVRYIIGLIIQNAFVGGKFRRKLTVIGALSVDQKAVNTITGSVHCGRRNRLGKRNLAHKGQHRVFDAVREHLVRIAGKGGFYPLRLPILLEQPRAEFTRCSGAFAIVVLGRNRNRVGFPALQGAPRIADKGLLFVRHNAAVPIADAVCLHRNAHLRQYDILLFGLDKKRKFRQGVDHG